MVAARGPKTFISYGEEYNWQRYLYGVYLLGSGPNTEFKYVSTFQFPLLGGNGRTDGLQIFDNQLLNLGAPLKANYSVSQDGLYWRKFENALVVVNPHDSKKTINTSDLRSHIPEGAVTGQLPSQLGPGQIALVTVEPQFTKVGRRIDFSDPAVSSLFSLNETMFASDKSLRIKESEPAFLNDILLNIVKYRSHEADLSLKFRLNGTRTTDKKIVLVAEVDDNRTVNLEKRRRNIVFELLTGDIPNGKSRTEVVKKPIFRFETQSDTAEDVLLIRIPNAIQNTTGSQQYTFNPQVEIDVNHGHIKFRRWDMMRFYGDFSLQLLTIGKDHYIDGARGY
jgi:hypothetical protein